MHGLFYQGSMKSSVRMYFPQGTPHIYAFCSEDVAAIDLITGKASKGQLPPKVLAMVRVWLGLHRDTMQEIDDTQEFKEIPSLA